MPRNGRGTVLLWRVEKGLGGVVLSPVSELETEGREALRTAGLETGATTALERGAPD